DEEAWEDEDSEEVDEEFDTANIDETDSSSGEDNDDDAENEDEDEDIPLSDLDSIASDDKGDILPHQRLTINNKAALLSALKSIALPADLPFSSNQVITSSEPIEIADIDDDLGRELAFYKQSLEAAKKGQELLRKEGVPFTRPNDYFAEMVKSDEHMGKIKQKLIDEAASKKAATEARKQRDLKKFGKQVQVAKQQERDKAKRDTLEKINILKRKRANAPIANETEQDLFDVGVEEDDAPVKRAKTTSRGDDKSKGKFKRAQKDQKYGFGGKKRFAKSNDAQSSADASSFPGKRMKDGPGFKKTKTGAVKRPGKARR
ncbi:eukaryotic rRNA processing, partial [Pseudovirgaria hyperparasitica]